MSEPVVDLMAALEKSVADAKALRQVRDAADLNCPKCYGRKWHFIWCPDARS